MKVINAKILTFEVVQYTVECQYNEILGTAEINLLK